MHLHRTVAAVGLSTGIVLSLTVLTVADEIDKAAGEKSPEMQVVTLAQGGITLSLPVDWKAQRLRSRILEREFEIPTAKGDEIAGRLTMMRSGGSVQANVDRWIGQFTQPDGKPTSTRAKVKDEKWNNQEVKLVDISGTFKDQQGGGPFAPGRVVERPGFRMLAAIVQTDEHGQYFFKLYGPEKTIAAAEKSFLAMIQSVKSP